VHDQHTPSFLFLISEGGVREMIELKITDMSCEHCARAVTEALGCVAGVTRVKTLDLESGLALVEGEVDPGTLVAAVEAAGYGAELVSE